MTAPEWFEAALAVEPESRTLEVEGVEIAVRIWGPADAAKAAVLVHGGSANMRWWDHIAPMLGPERRVVALDLSGHGDSPRRSSYSVDEWSAEVAAVATMPGMPAKPTLIGHSMGGWVVLNCGVRHAEQIGGVVVLDSPVREPTPEQKEALAKRAFGPLKVYPDKADRGGAVPGGAGAGTQPAVRAAPHRGGIAARDARRLVLEVRPRDVRTQDAPAGSAA